MDGFVVHALPVAGGILAIAPLPGLHGDYKGDLAHLRDWQPAMVITMMTLPELVAHNTAQLGADISDMGSRWVHFPVEDFGIPDEPATREWRSTSKVALSALKGGGRVLIHCRSGCGRSGMTALRLMIAAKEKPDIALERLRAVRPCAIETDEQMAWARSR